MNCLVGELSVYTFTTLSEDSGQSGELSLSLNITLRCMLYMMLSDRVICVFSGPDLNPN